MRINEITLDVFQYIYGLADSLYSNAKEYVNEISHNVSQFHIYLMCCILYDGYSRPKIEFETLGR